MNRKSARQYISTHIFSALQVSNPKLTLAVPAVLHFKREGAERGNKSKQIFLESLEAHSIFQCFFITTRRGSYSSLGNTKHSVGETAEVQNNSRLSTAILKHSWSGPGDLPGPSDTLWKQSWLSFSAQTSFLYGRCKSFGKSRYCFYSPSFGQVLSELRIITLGCLH